MIDLIASWLANAFFDAAMAVEAWRVERADRGEWSGEWIEGPVICRHCRYAFHAVSPHPEPGLKNVQCPRCFRCEAEEASIGEWEAAKEAMN